MAKRYTWTPKRIERMKAMIGEGYTYRQIAKRLRISRDAVKGAATYYGLQDPTRRRPCQPWSLAEYDALEQMILAGDTYRHIAEQMGRTIRSVRDTTHRLGLSHPARQARRSHPQWPQMDPIIEQCVKDLRMCIPQLEQRLTALGYQVSADAIRYHLRHHHPRTYAQVVENAADRRARCAQRRGMRAQARKRQQVAA